VTNIPADSGEAFTMPKLAETKCTVWRSAAPPATDAEVAELHPLIPAWLVVEQDGERRLLRVFHFQNSAHALAFSNRVESLAQAAGHHPAMLMEPEWGRVAVTWWTPRIRGLQFVDFVMAAKTDLAYGDSSQPHEETPNEAL
jgi:4a-hydroxytetrahydrobiopterin dehydratase